MRELYARDNEVVRRIFALPQVSPDVVSQEVTLEVLPYLEKLAFRVFPESEAIQLGIVRPDQTLVRTEAKGVAVRQGKRYNILALAEPPPGLWKYMLLKGKGRVLQWTQMRLCTSLPIPGTATEDHRFAQVAGPYLDSFFDQASWP